MDMRPDNVSPAEAEASTGRASRLSLAFAADPRGRTYLHRQFAGYPFHVCKVLYEDHALPGMGTIYTQSCSGGLYEDDRHSIEITAAAGALAHVTTQASTIVHSMRRREARQDTVIRAAQGCHLEVIPDPQILFPEAAYVSTTRVAAGRDASVILSESFLTHDPEEGGRMPSRYASEIVVEDGEGRIAAIDRIRLDKASFAHGTPGVMGAFRAYGTVLAIAPARLAGLADTGQPQAEGALIGVSDLPSGAGRLYRVLATDGAQLKRAMTACWSQARLAILGSRPAPRRK